MSENSAANSAQREYWNTVAGPRWVGLEGFCQRRVRAVNDLLRFGRGSRLASECSRLAVAPAPLPYRSQRPSASAARSWAPTFGRDAVERPQAPRRSRATQRFADRGRCAKPSIRAWPFRSDRLALWRHVFRRSEGSFRQSARRGTTRGSAVLCLLGSAGRQSPLARPLRGGPAPPRAAGAKAAACARPDGIRRPRLRALLPRRRRVRGDRNSPRDPGRRRLDAAGGGQACLHHGTLGPAYRREETRRSDARDDPARNRGRLRRPPSGRNSAAAVDGAHRDRAPPTMRCRKNRMRLPTTSLSG